jgi:hypothetical protein
VRLLPIRSRKPKLLGAWSRSKHKWARARRLVVLPLQVGEAIGTQILSDGSRLVMTKEQDMNKTEREQMSKLKRRRVKKIRTE